MTSFFFDLSPILSTPFFILRNLLPRFAPPPQKKLSSDLSSSLIRLEIPGGLGGRLECGALVCTEVAELKGGAGQPGREPGPALSRAVEARGARGRTRRGGPFRSPWMEPRLTPGRDALHGGRGSSPSLTFPRFVPLRPTPHLLSLSLSVSPAPSPTLKQDHRQHCPGVGKV